LVLLFIEALDATLAYSIRRSGMNGRAYRGGAAITSGAGRYTDRTFSFAGTLDLPERLDGRFSTPIDLKAQMAAGGTQALALADGSLALKGKLTVDAGSFDGLDATVALSLPALAASRSALSRALPALTDVSLGGRLSIPADLLCCHRPSARAGRAGTRALCATCRRARDRSKNGIRSADRGVSFVRAGFEGDIRISGQTIGSGSVSATFQLGAMLGAGRADGIEKTSLVAKEKARRFIGKDFWRQRVIDQRWRGRRADVCHDAILSR